MKIKIAKSDIKFSFKKYCSLITSVFPNTDLIGIEEICFVTEFTNPKVQERALACYFQKDQKNKKSAIEVNINKLLEHKIPDYLFEFFPEIAALFLSEIVAHEVGHHAHSFNRHGVKKNSWEKFADSYAKAGYYHYLTSRYKKILSSYKVASLNVLLFEKEDRQSYAKGRDELIKWVEENKQGIAFP